jgi:alkanesulfonate monooxygenase SsuD/methylene tetrahydromethanopterin reductase-like flavin-dependent oxidoreductase (luciferase family)
MCEQGRPQQRACDIKLAEQAGFDFAIMSDRYSPWLDSRAHSPSTWSVLGAAAWPATTLPHDLGHCPIRRYHPAVVAQKAATRQLLAGTERACQRFLKFDPV